MKAINKLSLALITLFLTLHLSSFGGGFSGPHYVKNSATGAGDGSSWTDAITDLQVAINLALDGDTIYVAAGTYLPTQVLGTDLVRSVTFYINKPIVIYGGFSGDPGTEGNPEDRNPKVHLTKLSGDTGVPGDETDNTFHIVYFDHVSDSTRLDGFIIENGNNFNGPGFEGIGAGIFNNAEAGRSHPVIANCVIQNCTAQETGGGMANYAGNGGKANPLILNCNFINNDGSGGGAITNYTETDGEANPVLINCQLIGNSARTADGGAISSIAHSSLASPVLINCVVTGNYNPTSGAFQSFVTGTGAAKPQFINCAFSGNAGDGVRIVDLGSQTSTLTIRNSIFFGNTTGAGISVNGATVDAAYSVIPFGFPGDHIIGLNPMFVLQPPIDSAHIQGDLHLQEGSPAIDAGRNEDLPGIVTGDVDGKPRKVNATDGSDGTIDIGPYEFQPVITSTSAILTDADWSFAPNPATDIINIQLPEIFHTGEIRLMDVQGKLLYTQPLQGGQTNSTLEIDRYPAGSYFLYLRADGMHDVKKLVKH
jgi:hypothetical protein